MPINVTKIRIKIKNTDTDIVDFKDFVKIIRKYKSKYGDIRETAICNYKCYKVFSELSQDQVNEIKDAAYKNYCTNYYENNIFEYYFDEILAHV